MAATENATASTAKPATHSATEARRRSTPHRVTSDNERYLVPLKRIVGQARGIHRMMDEEKYCIDILPQVSALTKALESVALGLLDDHLRHCVVDAAIEGGRAADAKLKETSDAIARLVRS